MAAEDVFEFLQSNDYKDLNLVISASFFEIYNGNVLDLLANKARLMIHETPKRHVDVMGLTERVVPSVDELLQLIQEGSTARTAGKTWANYTSSRSHEVFQIIVRKQGFQDIHDKF
jgi:kinesin family protein 2/24